MEKRSSRLKISFNSPVILGFTMICLLALLLGYLTKGRTTVLLFGVSRSPLISPFTYIRLIGHVFGHADWEHFIGNITLILIIGPLLEEKYGSANILFVILATALVTGIVHSLLFPNVLLLGASGVVFAFILLSSLTSIREGEIPLTFILVAVIYLGGQVWQGIAVKDNVSNLTHIIGGLVGAALGYVMNKNKMARY